MPRSTPTVVNRETLVHGGATNPTVELYQLASGRCRLWSYWFDEDGGHKETIVTFTEKAWIRARERALDTLYVLAGRPPR